jgi:two-component system, HptB-dependent secretion and biofilm response regulator
MALIMIADDDENFLTMISAFLETMGHTVVGAKDPLDLFRQMQGLKPDLFVLDMMMPGGGGPGAVKFLAETPRAAAVPILIVSSSPVEQQKKQFADVGHMRFFKKPLDLTAFGAAVDELVKK